MMNGTPIMMQAVPISGSSSVNTAIRAMNTKLLIEQRRQLPPLDVDRQDSRCQHQREQLGKLGRLETEARPPKASASHH
jgi:hypothetical protein